MYYNYTDEEKYFLSVTDAMLKDDYSVEEILEFWNCDDEEQVEGILSSLILTESVDLGNPELLIICERIGLGAIGGWLAKQATKLKGLFSRGGSTKQLSIPGMNQGSGIRGLGSKIKNSPAGQKVTKAAKNVKNKLNTPLVKGAAITTGAGLALVGGKEVLDNITGSGNDSTTNGDQPKGPGGVDAPTTPVVKPRRNWGYDKYKSSKKYYDNIRGKN